MIRKDTASEKPSADAEILLKTCPDLLRVVERERHPSTVSVLNALLSMQVDPKYAADLDKTELHQETAQRRIGEIAYLGTMYFDSAVHNLAKFRAIHERPDKSRWAKGSYEIPEPLQPVPTDALETSDVVRSMVSQQAGDAFDVAYQGPSRLPSFASAHNQYNEALPNSLAAGLVVSKVMGITIEDYAAAAYQSGGNPTMIAGAYKALKEGLSVADAYTINGQPAAYRLAPEELGYSLFRSRRSAARGVLETSRVFWPRDHSGYNESADTEDTANKPIFSDADAAHVCQSAYDIKLLLSRKDSFPPLTPDLLVQILDGIEPGDSGLIAAGEDDDYSVTFKELAAEFNLDAVEDTDAYLRQILSTGHEDVTWAFYRAFSKQHLPAMEIFRANISPEAFDFTQAITNGELTEEHAKFGINQACAKGLDQLRAAIRNIETFLIEDTDDSDKPRAEIEKISDSTLYERLWRTAVRFDVTYFGNSGTEEIIRVLADAAYSADYRDQSEPSIDRSVYKAQTAQVNEKTPSRNIINPDVRGSLDQFSEVARRALTEQDTTQTMETFENRISQTTTNLKELAEELSVQITTYAEGKKKNAAERRLSNLQVAIDSDFETDLAKDGGFVAAYKKLWQVGEARDILREKALRDCKAAMGTTVTRSYSALLKTESDEEKVDVVLDLIDHILVQEYLIKLLPEDSDYANFVTKKLFNTSVLDTASDEQMIQKNAASADTTAKKRNLKFTPTRGVGLELSGQIGDACWASKHGRVADTMPNMVGVLLSESRGDTEKLVGSSLLLEATSRDGEELLIVRGLNPIQSFISKVDAVDFLDKFLSYARETAIRDGRRLAIVYDYRGGASTNRPSLFNAIDTLVTTNDLKPVQVDPSQVEFNDHNLVGRLYLC